MPVCDANGHFCCVGYYFNSIMDYAQRLSDIRHKISNAAKRGGRDPQLIELVVVTKYHPIEAVQKVIEAGAQSIGENRVQELMQKAPLLDKKTRKHLIGPLQSNKVAKALGCADCIQSVDSEKILRKLQAACQQQGKSIDIFLQVNTTG